MASDLHKDAENRKKLRTKTQFIETIKKSLAII